MPLRKNNPSVNEQTITARFSRPLEGAPSGAGKSAGKNRCPSITLLIVLFLIAAEGFSCALSPAPPPSKSIDFALDQLPDDPAALDEMVHEYLDRGDIAVADAIIEAALQRNYSRSWKKEFRASRQKIRKAQFAQACPLKLEVVAPDRNFSFGDDLEVEFKISNLSSESLTIPSRGFFWWMPFAESRQSLIQVEFALTDITIDGVVSGGSWNEVITFDGSLTIDPESSESFFLDLSPTVRTALLYRRIAIDGEMIPGGLETDLFDYGVIRFGFDRGLYHFVAPDAVDSAHPTVADLQAAIARRDGGDILRLSVRLDENKIWEGVDLLVTALPSLAFRERQLAIAALRIMTAQNLGADFHRWINWWHERGPGLLEKETTSPAPAEAAPPFTPSVPGAILGMLPLGAIVANLPLDGSDRTRLGHESARGGTKARDELISPFFGRRQRAISRIADGGPAALDDLEALLGDAHPLLRAGAVGALGKIDNSASWALLRTALSVEEDRALRQSIVEALGRFGVPLGEFPTFWPSADRDLLREIYTRERITGAMESVMHGGMVPGFYDGQFSHFWDIAPDMTGRLVKIAHDADCHYIARVLAIMSLAEKPYPAMEKDLKGLIIPASSEIRREYYSFVDLIREDAVTEEMVVENRSVKLSGYARYALAKAGLDRYVLAKIKVMKEWINSNRAVIDEERIFSGIIGSSLQLKQEFGRTLYFDIGYEYQQLDDFEQAESWYLKLIENFPDSTARANTHYNLACLYSLQNRLDEAIHHLTQTVESGFFDFSWMDKDRDLDNVRDHPEFAALKKNSLPSGSAIGDDAAEGD